ncbi:Lon protease-like protein [Thalictrum thalictroides]|uniref:Lon protease-like protein n=1 Tax=Thalictrum thalictroides TaxID=46969 RepID=A0A7J6V2M3_THATH|nr:Lon protease-like protein [Thalictrum thalictroides]
MAESVELPSRLVILPFRNKVLLPGAIIRIRCTSPSSVKLVEQELWQREEKGLIGVLPVRDAAETASVGPMLSPGEFFNLCNLFLLKIAIGLCAYMIERVDVAFIVEGVATDSGERSSKVPASTSDGKNQQELIQWHTRCVFC